MSVFEEILAANASYAERFDLRELPKPPARHLAVVTCMDARIMPLAAFGLKLGDAHVIRNAGGRVTQHTVRSLLISTHLMDVRSVAIVHHTECGMAQYTEDQLRELTGANMHFAAITDPDEDLRADVDRARAAPLPKHTDVRGFLYDVRTGRLDQLV